MMFSLAEGYRLEQPSGSLSGFGPTRARLSLTVLPEAHGNVVLAPE